MCFCTGYVEDNCSLLLNNSIKFQGCKVALHAHDNCEFEFDTEDVSHVETLAIPLLIQ